MPKIPVQGLLSHAYRAATSSRHPEDDNEKQTIKPTPPQIPTPELKPEEKVTLPIPSPKTPPAKIEIPTTFPTQYSPYPRQTPGTQPLPPLPGGGGPFGTPSPGPTLPPPTQGGFGGWGGIASPQTPGGFVGPGPTPSPQTQKPRTSYEIIQEHAKQNANRPYFGIRTGVPLVTSWISPEVQRLEATRAKLIEAYNSPNNEQNSSLINDIVQGKINSANLIGRDGKSQFTITREELTPFIFRPHAQAAPKLYPLDIITSLIIQREANELFKQHSDYLTFQHAVDLVIGARQGNISAEGLQSILENLKEHRRFEAEREAAQRQRSEEEKRRREQYGEWNFYLPGNLDRWRAYAAQGQASLADLLGLFSWSSEYLRDAQNWLRESSKYNLQQLIEEGRDPRLPLGFGIHRLKYNPETGKYEIEDAHSLGAEIFAPIPGLNAATRLGAEGIGKALQAEESLRKEIGRIVGQAIAQRIPPRATQTAPKGKPVSPYASAEKPPVTPSTPPSGTPGASPTVNIAGKTQGIASDAAQAVNEAERAAQTLQPVTRADTAERISDEIYEAIRILSSEISTHDRWDKLKDIIYKIKSELPNPKTLESASVNEEVANMVKTVDKYRKAIENLEILKKTKSLNRLQIDSIEKSIAELSEKLAEQESYLNAAYKAIAHVRSLGLADDYIPYTFELLRREAELSRGLSLLGRLGKGMMDVVASTPGMGQLINIQRLIISLLGRNAITNPVLRKIVLGTAGPSTFGNAVRRWATSAATAFGIDFYLENYRHKLPTEPGEGKYEFPLAGITGIPQLMSIVGAFTGNKGELNRHLEKTHLPLQYIFDLATRGFYDKDFWKEIQANAISRKIIAPPVAVRGLQRNIAQWIRDYEDACKALINFSRNPNDLLYRLNNAYNALIREAKNPNADPNKLASLENEVNNLLTEIDKKIEQLHTAQKQIETNRLALQGILLNEEGYPYGIGTNDIEVRFNEDANNVFSKLIRIHNNTELSREAKDAEILRIAREVSEIHDFNRKIKEGRELWAPKKYTSPLQARNPEDMQRDLIHTLAALYTVRENEALVRATVENLINSSGLNKDVKEKARDEINKIIDASIYFANEIDKIVKSSRSEYYNKDLNEYDRAPSAGYRLTKEMRTFVDSNLRSSGPKRDIAMMLAQFTESDHPITGYALLRARNIARFSKSVAREGGDEANRIVLNLVKALSDETIKNIITDLYRNK